MRVPLFLLAVLTFASTAIGQPFLVDCRDAGETVESATLRHATLEDVFLKMTGRMLRD